MRKIRGMPLLREVQNSWNEWRKPPRSRTYKVHNEDSYAMSPANVDYPYGFVDAWHTIVPKEEEN